MNPGIRQGLASGPPAKADILLWLDARKGTTLTGSQVTNWADQSGHGFDANATTITGMIPQWPLLVASAMRGRPAVKISVGNSDGSDLIIGRQGMSPAWIPDSHNWCVGSAVRFLGRGGPVFLPSTVTDMLVNTALGTVVEGSTQYAIASESGFFNTAYSDSLVDYTNTSHTFVVNAASNAMDFQIDGASRPHGSFLASDMLGNGYTLGAKIGSAEPAFVLVGEVLVYDRSLTPTELSNLRAYLSGWV